MDPVPPSAKVMQNKVIRVSTDGWSRMAKGGGAWSTLLAADRSKDKGDLDRVQAELLHAIRCCRTGLDESIEEHDVEEVRRWCHCLAQISAAYTRTFREAELIPM